jgi:site-specific recombinase XerD
VQNHCGHVNDYLAELQDRGLKFGAVNNYIKAVKTFYRTNGVKIELSEPLKRKVSYRDRAPTPEELAKILDVANLREKVIVSMLALGAFREETLASLQYRHVRKDLENNITPIHVYVEDEIVKGKYGSYSTFLGAEAAHYLKLYIEDRKIGNIMDKKGRPPELLTDESPLIRDASSYTPKSVTSKQIRKIVHALYLKTGIIKQSKARFYDLRVHSLRKFFKTHLTALGMQPDYIDYMMGHIVDTYQDIQSLGVEPLRKAYQAAGLCIRKKTQLNKIDALKEIIRAYGMNPEQVLTQKALADGATTYQTSEDYENEQLRVLREELKQLVQQTATGEKSK